MSVGVTVRLETLHINCGWKNLNDKAQHCKEIRCGSVPLEETVSIYRCIRAIQSPSHAHLHQNVWIHNKGKRLKNHHFIETCTTLEHLTSL
jgi:hypothetical protein